MGKLRAEVWEKFTGFTKFFAVLSVEKDGIIEELWAEEFQGQTAAEGALKYHAKQYLKLRADLDHVASRVFEREWEF
jgi:hypothetical protein